MVAYIVSLPVRLIDWGLRDYGVSDQIGLESTPEEYTANMVQVFREVWRVLRDDGTLWLNLGDSYNGSAPNRTGQNGYNDGRTNRDSRFSVGGVDGLKPKDLVGIPWRVAFALQADGWYLRSDIIWAKPNPMPESVTDRPTKAHEYVFLLTKNARYFYDADAVREEAVEYNAFKRNSKKYQDIDTDYRRDFIYPEGLHPTGRDGRNRRTVWTIATEPTSDWGESDRLHHVSGDAPYDGKRRITSPCCPVHGGRLVQVANNLYGELLSGGLIRNVHTYDYLGQVPSDGLPAIPSIDGGEAPSYEQLRQKCSLSATLHNNEKSRTGRVPVTNQPCTACAETVYRIGGTSELRELYSQDHGIDENNIFEADWDDPSGQIPCGSVGMYSFDVPPNCTCSFYTISTESTSHFATYPRALVEPCIKAGCPVGGVVLDPFGGSGTTALVARELRRSAVICDLSFSYLANIARKRLGFTALEQWTEGIQAGNDGYHDLPLFG